MSHPRAPLLVSSIFLFVLSATLLPPLGRAQTAGHVVISEVMYDPAAPEPDTEWIELFNATATSVDLSGWRLKDNSTSQDAIPTFILEPGQYLVIAAKQSSFDAGFPGFSGNLVSLENALGNGLANGGDRVILLNSDGNPVDAVSYGSDRTALDPPCPHVAEGHSLARAPSDLDTNTAIDWIDRYLPSPGGPGSGPAPADTPTSTPTVILDETVTATTAHTVTATETIDPAISTATPTPTDTTTSEVPGTLTPTLTRTLTPSRTPTVTRTPSPTPASTSTPSTANPGDVVINEIMQNPNAVSETAGEWFEIYNASGNPIDLNGWRIKDAGSDEHRIQTTGGGSLWLPSGGYLVLGRDADPTHNGNVPIAYQYKGFTLGNTDGEIILLDGTGTEIDRVAYDGGPAFPDPDGASMQLIRPDLDNTLGVNWRISPEPWPGSAGDRGSPGAPNHTASIQAYVYEDLNGNRTREDGEPGIAGVVISLSNGRTTRSTASGWYGFTDLAPGTYEVIEAQPAGYTSTTPDRRTVTVALGQLVFGPSFGEQHLPPTETPTPGPSPTATPSRWSQLLLSEVLYDAPQGGTDSAYEWLEVFNPGEAAVSLAGWAVGDNGGRNALPAASLDPGAYLVIAATETGFRANHPDFAGKLLNLEGSIGNGLSNTSDVVRLLAPDGALIDAMSYGENAAAFAPPCFDVPAGQSLARVPALSDTDTAADWAPQTIPNPGGPGSGPMLTPTPTDTAQMTDTPSPTLTITPVPTPTATSGPLPRVRLNEILPRPDSIDWDGNGTTDAYDEWVEIINLSTEVIDLGGWTLDDILGGGSAPYLFPPGTRLNPGGFLVRYRSTTGVALNQDADTVHLLAPDGSVADIVSYTNPGRDASYSRTIDGTGDWTEDYPPSPGRPNVPGATTPTGTPTATPSQTPTLIGTPTPTSTAGPLPRVRLNEILPRPEAIDWDGSGAVDAYDEWIEITNLGDDGVDLGDWALDDIPGGSAPYLFPPGTRLGPGEFLVRYRSTTGVALNQDADTARLLAPDGREADAFSYRNPSRDASYSRAVDGTGDWTEAYPPSPGGPNRPGAPTATATAVTYDRTALRLNEVLPAPSEIDWNGDGAADTNDEWVEIFNRGSAAVDLGGWLLDDIAAGGSTPYVVPSGAILQPGGFLLLFRGHTGVALNNDGDTVRLLGPDAAEVDTFAYAKPKNDRSYSRATDGGGAWTETYPPSPGRSNVAATPTPTPTATPTSTPFPAGVTLNEILPDPQRVDWDQNGAADFVDEWIELYNAGPAPAALGGWAILDDTKAYTLPLGLTIWPGSHLLLFRRETGLSLSDWRDRVTLVRPDGSTADQFTYDRGPGADRAFCRDKDGSGAWTNECVATPGLPNRLLPHSPSGGGSGAAAAQPTRSPLTGAIAAARAAPDDTRVTVAGAVTLPPGLYGRNIYLQDTSGGIKVYLRSGDYPALAAGDRLRVTGWTRQFHGEVELSVPGPSYLTRLGPGEPPDPVYVRTGQVGEAHEGRLIWIAGRVVRFEPQALTLDDGTGPTRIFFPAELPWRRPYVEIGEFWAAQGVVGQYAFEAPWEGGYRLIPRFVADVRDAPMVLPVTGGG